MSFILPFFKKQKKVITNNNLENIPNHVAIIMDGNGRWANQRSLPRIAGHKEGMHVVQNIVRAAVSYEIKILTLYAFSTENWKRPKSEVDYLMKLPKEFLHIFLPELIEKNVRIHTIGEFSALPESTQTTVNYAIEKTKNNTGLILNFALNYGGRYEILRAVENIITDLKEGKIAESDIDEEKFNNYLYTTSLSDPDLIIRTSGEQRLSNFLLWQAAYSEFWFTDVLWPDFTEEIFNQALTDYQTRIRRYGGIKGS